MIKPLLKWPGGKRKLAPQILSMIRPGDTLVEPFCGAAAVGLNYEGPTVLSDNCWRLMECYKAVARNPQGVIKALKGYERRYLELPYVNVTRSDHFYEKRDLFNLIELEWIDIHGQYRKFRPERFAALFIFLNRTCYNGMYRENLSGNFNVPHGRHSNPTICFPSHIHMVSGALRSTKLITLDYAAMEARGWPFRDWPDGASTTYYLDPPYDGGFAEYLAGGFDWVEQRYLAKLAARLVVKGARVIASNANTPRIRWLWGSYGFELNEVMEDRSISCDASTRGKVTGLLMVKG